MAVPAAAAETPVAQRVSRACRSLLLHPGVVDKGIDRIECELQSAFRSRMGRG